jgi:hypothetical protein
MVCDWLTLYSSTCSKCVSCDRSYAKVFTASVDTVVPAIYLATYCETCHAHFKKGDYCPLCMHVYSDNSSNITPMVCCDVCDRWVHVSCDKEGAREVLEKSEDAPYICILCDPVKLSKFGAAIAGRKGSLRVGAVEGKSVASPLIGSLIE